MSGTNVEWLEGYQVDPEEFGAVSLVGVGHVTAELEAIAARLQEPERAEALGLEPPRGVLLWGPPGTGKTLSARYLASLLGSVHCYEVPPDELTPRKLRWVVRHLSQHDEPSVLFFDEIDGFAIRRDDPSHTPETRALLMAALAALDGLVPHAGPLFVAASNRPPTHLDPAFVRAGRFDYTVALTRPDEDERLALLEHFARDLPIADGIDWRSIAAHTLGATPADLKGYLNDAAALAFRAGRSDIDDASIGQAVGRRGHVYPEREPEKLSEQDRRRFSVHEAGHTITAAVLFGLGEVQRVSIDLEGGDTKLVAEGHTWTESRLLDDLAVAFGGMIAERTILGEATTGTTHDMEHALWLVRQRIRAGHSPTALPVDMDEYRQSMPPRVLHLWAQEVEGLLWDARERARRIVEEHQVAVERFARRLAQDEELAGEELRSALTDALGGVSPADDRAEPGADDDPPGTA